MRALTMDVVACSAAISACEKNSRWQDEGGEGRESRECRLPRLRLHFFLFSVSFSLTGKLWFRCLGLDPALHANA